MLRNAQGDILSVYDSKSVKVGSYVYDSWGKLVSLKAETNYPSAEKILKTNPFRYRGYYYDTETSLYYLNSRYYDPETGRFVNADGQLNQDEGSTGYNMFQYCGNNPINRSDPTGYAWYNDVIDWFLPGSSTRASKAFSSPYNFGNWLTMGFLDNVKGAVSPEKLLSPQHFMDSLTTAVTIFGVGSAIKTGAATMKEVSKAYSRQSVRSNPITGYTRHGINQAINRDGRGVKPSAILDTVKNPIEVSFQSNNNTIKYVGNQATVVLNQSGKLVTTWSHSSTYGRIDVFEK